MSVDTVDTHDVLDVSIARRELAVLGGGGHVVLATDQVISVLAVIRV